MATMLDLNIAGRTYQVACREGEEDNLRAAARLVDDKPQAETVAPSPPPAPSRPDPAVILRAEALADRLESLAMTLEKEAANP